MIFLAALAAAFHGVLPSRVDFRRGVSSQMTFLATVDVLTSSPASEVRSSFRSMSVGPLVARLDGALGGSGRRRAISPACVREICVSGSFWERLGDLSPPKVPILQALLTPADWFVTRKGGR